MNKKIIVTGSNGGIGKEVCQILLDNNYEVYGLDLNKNDIDNSHFHFYQCDISKSTEIKKIKDILEKDGIRIDAIYNLAGIFMMQSMLEGKEEDLRKIFDINFFGAYYINKIFFPLLNKKARIMIFSSEVARYSPQPFNGYYSLGKVTVDRYADVLRREMNYLDIDVIKVEAGAIKTNLLTGVNAKYQEMVVNSKYYKDPLTKLKKLMDDEINKQTNPKDIAIKLVKIMEKKNPRISYHIKNSKKLELLDVLPEKLQDIIYKNVIK